MVPGLTAERVHRDIEVLAHAGLDLDTFIGEAVDSLQRAIPYVAACLATVDPSTQLLTSTRKYGDLYGRDEHDHQWGLIEYGTLEATTFRELSRTRQDAAGVLELTRGRGVRSHRLLDFIGPTYGYADELRAVFRDGDQVWGGLALFRGVEGARFAEHEVDLVGSLSAVFAAGVRTGLLARIGAAPPAASTGPAVLIVGADDQVRQMSLGAEERLAELVSLRDGAAATGIIASLVAAARGYARGETAVPPRSRVRSRSGMWLVLHATPLTAAGGVASGDVVITMEEARPPEIVPLVVAAFGLTQRERDVTQLVLQGVDTKEIAATMHVSTYTVQDHLKSIFDKADVRSRRELIARIYFDQYVPRMGAELGPMGWFTAV